MKTKVSILFYAKKAKAATNGLVPIYTRITIGGKRIELSTNRFVETSKWPTEAGKMKGASEEARSINNHLELLKNQIRDAEMELVYKRLPVTTGIPRKRWTNFHNPYATIFKLLLISF